MEVIVLGSGTCVPNLHRSESAYVIKAGKQQLLFDCGAGTKRRLVEAKIYLRKIDYMFFTHCHNDHINDLPALLWSYAYTGFTRKKEMKLVGPKGFKEYFKVVFKLLKFENMPFKINIKEVKNNTTQIDGAYIKSAPIIHSKNWNNVAYRIEYHGKAIVYSGDAEYTDELVELAKNTDLLILECSNPNEAKFPGHLIPDECGKIAARANAKVLMLTHFYPKVEKINIKAQIAKIFKGKIIIAKDLMRLKV
ncbi:MBL fold metallo-hydrolase [Candidatus Woesearchaeota archaeon]|nr:MBL fold metallo-hydrolase [Candidatus Woesearchaeota archaeon]